MLKVGNGPATMIAFVFLAFAAGCATVRPSGTVEMTVQPDKGQALDEEPVPVRTVQPVYPEFAREAHIQGRVVLHVLVGEDGHVQAVEVIEPIVGLTDSAVEAVKQWEFQPGTRGGHPVASWLEVPIVFHIDGAGR